MEMNDIWFVQTFSFSASAILILAAVYPFLIYPVLLRLITRKPYPQTRSMDKSPSVALLFCAYNEERSLPEKIKNLRAIKSRVPEIEIHAYTDCCTDDTVTLLRRASDVVTLHEGIERLGKASGMRMLVAATNAEILIFSDANVIIDPDSVRILIDYFSDSQIGTVAATLHYTNPHDGHPARVSTMYWRLEESIKQRESLTGSTMGADGSTFAMRRSLYPSVPGNLLDDFIASINPVFLGYRVVSAPDVHAFEKAPTKSSDEFRRKRRIACRAMNTHKFLRPGLLKMSALNRFKYFSHKFLRWMSPFLLAMAAAFGSVGFVSWLGLEAAGLLGLVSGLVLVGGHLLKVPVLANVTEILLNLTAVGVGIVEAMLGRDYQTWRPVESRDA